MDLFLYSLRATMFHARGLNVIEASEIQRVGWDQSMNSKFLDMMNVGQGCDAAKYFFS